MLQDHDIATMPRRVAERLARDLERDDLRRWAAVPHGDGFAVVARTPDDRELVLSASAWIDAPTR